MAAKGEIDTKHFLLAIIAIVAIVAISFIAVMIGNNRPGKAIQPIVIEGTAGAATYALSTDKTTTKSTSVVTKLPTSVGSATLTEIEEVQAACDSSDFNCCMQECVGKHGGDVCGARCGWGYTVTEVLMSNCDFLGCNSIECSWQC